MIHSEPKPRKRRKGQWHPPSHQLRPRSSSSRRRFARRVALGIWHKYRDFIGKLGVKPDQPRPTRAGDLLSRLHLREIITAILSLIPASATVLLTYSGVSDGLAEAGATLTTKTEAALFSFGIGTLCFLVNFHLFGLVDRLRGRYLTKSMIGGIALLVAIAAIDAPFHMRGLAGGTAVRMSIEGTAAFCEDQSRAVFAHVGLAQQLLTSLRANAKLFLDQQAHEFKTGAMSGARGPGKVELAFGRVGSLLGPLADDIEKDAAKAEALQDAISESIREIKRQVYVQGALRSRIELASIAADKVDTQLGRLARRDLTVSIRATLKSIEGLFPNVPAPAAKTALERRQNEAIAQIAAMTVPITAALQEALESFQPVTVAVVKPVRPQNASEAIWTYAGKLIPEWIAAILVTLAGPLCLLLMQIAARREAESLGDNDDGEVK